MKFVITLTYLGNTLWMRSTVTTLEFDRASRFDSREAAQANIDKARKFHKVKTIKAMQIVEVAA
jgi:hypothetical protein